MKILGSNWIYSLSILWVIGLQILVPTVTNATPSVAVGFAFEDTRDVFRARESYANEKFQEVAIGPESLFGVSAENSKFHYYLVGANSVPSENEIESRIEASLRRLDPNQKSDFFLVLLSHGAPYALVTFDGTPIITYGSLYRMIEQSARKLGFPPDSIHANIFIGSCDFNSNNLDIAQAFNSVKDRRVGLNIFAGSKGGRTTSLHLFWGYLFRMAEHSKKLPNRMGQGPWERLSHLPLKIFFDLYSGASFSVVLEKEYHGDFTPEDLHIMFARWQGYRVNLEKLRSTIIKKSDYFKGAIQTVLGDEKASMPQKELQFFLKDINSAKASTNCSALKGE